MKKVISLVIFLLSSFLVIGCGDGTTNVNNEDKSSNDKDDKKVVKTITFDEAHKGINDAINIDKLNKIDYYDIDLTADTYTMYTDLLAGTQGDYIASPFHISITNPTGVEVLSYDIYASIGTRKNATFLATEAGVYRVKVYRTNNKKTSYTFSLYHSLKGGLVQEEDERNDNEYMATPKTFTQANTGINGSLNIRASDVADYYDIDLTADTYTMYTDLLAGTQGDYIASPFHISITNPTGVEVLSYDIYASIGTRKNATFLATEAGIYRVKVYRTNNKKTSYTFSLYHSLKGGLIQEEDERNDNEYMATPKTFTQANTGINGSLNVRASDVADYYDIDLTADTYTMYTDLLEGTQGDYIASPFHISVTNPAGVEVLSYDIYASIGRRKDATFLANQAGVYRVKVYRTNNKKTSYKFSFSKTTPTR